MAGRRIVMPAGSAGIFRFYEEESRGPRISAITVIAIALLFVVGIIIIKKILG